MRHPDTRLRRRRDIWPLLRGAMSMLVVAGGVVLSVLAASGVVLSLEWSAVTILLTSAIVLLVGSAEFRQRTVRGAALLLCVALVLLVLRAGKNVRTDEERSAARAKATVLADGTMPVAASSVLVLCRHAGGDFAELSSTAGVACQPASDPRHATLHDLRISVARADLEDAVVDAEASVEGADERVESARETLAEAASHAHDSLIVEAVESVPAGGRALVAVFPGVQSNTVPVVPGVLGWITLGVVALWLFGLMDRRAARQLVGPVAVRPATSVSNGASTSETPNNDENGTEAGRAETRKDDSKQDSSANTLVTAHLRSALRRLPESDVIPSASGREGASGALALFDAVDATATLSKVAAAIRSTIVHPVGYVVAAEVLPRLEESEPQVVVVRILDAETERTLATQIFPDSTPAVAARTGGYWATGWISSCSRALPTWEQWLVDDTEALREYDRSEQESGSDAAGAAESLADVVVSAPTCGVLLARVGSFYSLAGRPLKAFEFYSRAATLYPRYFAARYRAAVTMSLIAGGDSVSQLQDAVEKEVFEDRLRRLTDACGVRYEHAGDVADPAWLCEISALLLMDLAKHSGPFGYAGRALRRAERATSLKYALPLVRRGVERPDVLARSASLGVRARSTEIRLRHGWHRSWLQVSTTEFHAAVASWRSLRSSVPPERAGGWGYRHLESAVSAVPDQIDSCEWHAVRGTYRSLLRVRRWLRWFSLLRPWYAPGDARVHLQTLAVHARRSLENTRIVHDSLDVRRLFLDARRIERKARRARARAEVRYNVACLYAIDERPGPSLDMLGLAVESEGAAALTAEWLRADPDLESVRISDSVRFDRIIERLEKHAKPVFQHG